MTPSVSIVITTYNRAQFLREAVSSVLAQTYRNFELVIWDDGSTDDSLDIAYHYAQQDERVRVIAAPHQGIAPTLKAAIAATTGAYLGWVDSDDILAATALKETVTILNTQPTVGLVYTDCDLIDEQGTPYGADQRCQIPYSKERLLVDFMTFHFRLLRRSVYDQVGGIDASFDWAEDYDLCLKLSEVTEVRHIQKPLYHYRRHASNITNNQLEAVRWAAKAIEHALKRRGLDEHIRLEMQVVSTFVLLPKHSAASTASAYRAAGLLPKPAFPLVSIIIACYNAAARLEPCLQSCFQQRHPNLEIIVIDNNSTDATVETVKRCAETSPHPLHLLSCQTQGANAARNYGFEQAQGDYIQWLDADDELEPDKIAQQVAALEQDRTSDIAYGDWDWCFYDKRQLMAQFTFPGNEFNDILLQLLLDNWRPPHAYLLRRSAAEQLHQMSAWNPDTQICMDREYFTLAALVGFKFLYVSGSRVRYYYWSSTQLTQSVSASARVQSRYQIFQRFQTTANTLPPGSLHKLHQLLLHQNWELWCPAFTVVQPVQQPLQLHHRHRQDTLALDSRDALIIQAFLLSPDARPLEDHARSVLYVLWREILTRMSHSHKPNQPFNLALISAELASILGLSTDPAVSSIGRSPHTDPQGLDPLQSGSDRLDSETRCFELSPWLLQIPLFSPLFAEHRLVIYGVLERLRQMGWLESGS